MSDEWLDDLGDYENVSDAREEFDALSDELSKLYNTTPLRIDDLERSTRVINDSISKIEADLEKNKELSQEAQEKLDSAKSNLVSMQSSVADLKKALDKTRQNLENIGITSAETIVSPVNTRIEPIASESSKLAFTFPFLMMLVIMFVALLLSSNIVIFEKSSKSFFRNHITPTGQEFFVITTFITSLIVTLFQTIIIMGLANYFMHLPLFKNLLSTLLLIFVSSAFFIVLGMAIGYLFSTQEGAIMGSVILGSIFLFLSNLVIPLESFAPWLSSIIKYNPYVLSSELLRKSLLFDVLIKESLFTLLALGGSAALILLLIILSIGLRNKKRIKSPKEPPTAEGERALSNAGKGDSRAPNMELVIGDRIASDKKELLNLVSDISKAEFEEAVNPSENRIADWAEKAMGDKKLASKLRKTSSRKEMIRILSEEAKNEDEQEEA
jgi:ABC-type multidrug transport system permease subunit